MTFSCSETARNSTRSCRGCTSERTGSCRPCTWVNVTDEPKYSRAAGLRVFGAVHKTDNGAAVPVAEAVHLLQYSAISRSAVIAEAISGNGWLGRNGCGSANRRVNTAGCLGPRISSNHEFPAAGLGRSKVSHAVADTQHNAGILGRVAVRGGVVEVLMTSPRFWTSMSASWRSLLNFQTMKMVLVFGLAVTCCDSEASIKFTVRPYVPLQWSPITLTFCAERRRLGVRQNNQVF